MRDDNLTLDDPENRQRHPRLSVLIGATVSCGGTEIMCDVIDLSAGGAKVRSDKPLTEGAAVVLSMEGVSDFHGTVAWRDGDQAGIQFRAGDEISEDKVAEVIDAAKDPRDRRADMRISVLWFADLYVGIRHYRCKILNISAGGAMLCLDGTLPADKTLTLRSPNFGEFKADVVWQSGGSVGVRFHGRYDLTRLLRG